MLEENRRCLVAKNLDAKAYVSRTYPQHAYLSTRRIFYFLQLIEAPCMYEADSPISAAIEVSSSANGSAEKPDHAGHCSVPREGSIIRPTLAQDERAFIRIYTLNSAN